MVDILLNRCIKSGFFLDKEMLDILKSLELKKIDAIVELVPFLNLKEKVLTKRVFLKNRSKIEEKLNKKGISFDEILEINYKNQSEPEINNEILQPTFEQKKFDINDFLINYRQRYNILKEKFDISKYPDITSIRKLPKTGSFTIIGSIYEKKIVKNKNLLVTVDDMTGNTSVLFPKNNSRLYEKIKDVFLDETVVIRGNIVENLLIANDVVFSNVKLNEEKKTDEDCWVAFIGDLHCGSINFLEKNFLKFVKWLNNDSEKYGNISKDIKYLFIGGDLIDGIGVYQGQEQDLLIKKISDQYKKVDELLDLIRENLKIYIIPGERDAVWCGEPQQNIDKKYFKKIGNKSNIRFLGNPSFVSIENNIKIFMYHGTNMYNLINENDDMKNKYGYIYPNLLMKELLNAGQISLSYGKTDLAIDKTNSLVFNENPDIIFTSHFHRCNVDIKNNILLVNSSCWAKNTNYLDKKGFVSDYCKVPLINLKTRDIKILDFSDENIDFADKVNI